MRNTEIFQNIVVQTVSSSGDGLTDETARGPRQASLQERPPDHLELSQEESKARWWRKNLLQHLIGESFQLKSGTLPREYTDVVLLLFQNWDLL